MPRIAGPVREAALFAVSVALEIVHGVQPGPVMTMVALAGSKLAPLSVSENCWVTTGRAGLVDRLVRDGMAATVSGRVPEVAPVAAFCRAMVNVPLPSVTGPVTETALLAVSVGLATVQGPQPGPVMTMVALAGSKLAPLSVSENCWVARGDEGVVDRLVKTGTAPTASGSAPDIAPLARFCTAAVKVPLPRVTGPVRDPALFAVNVALATVHGLQPGPLMRMTALAGSKLAPAAVSEKV